MRKLFDKIISCFSKEKLVFPDEKNIYDFCLDFATTLPFLDLTVDKKHYLE